MFVSYLYNNHLTFMNKHGGLKWATIGILCKSNFIDIDINIIFYEKNTFAIRSRDKLQNINTYTHSINLTFKGF